MSANTKNTNISIYSRITQKEKEKILALVEKGTYMSPADFVRQAIREKLGDN